MEQANTAMAVTPKLLRRALRILLLLGAPLAWWLLCVGDGAQADDVQEPKSVPAVTQQVDSVHQATKAVPGALRQAPAGARAAVVRSTESAPEPLRTTTTVVLTTVEPTLSDATSALADHIDQTVRTVDTTLQPLRQVAVPAPTKPPPDKVVERRVSTDSPVSPRARWAHPHDAVNQSRVVPAQDIDGLRASAQEPAAGQDPDRGRGAVPTDRAMTPTGSGGSSYGAAAVLALLLLMPPAAIGRRPHRRSNGLPAGPAYPPGSSPD